MYTQHVGGFDGWIETHEAGYLAVPYAKKPILIKCAKELGERGN